MKSRTNPASELRARLMRAADELQPDSPLRLLAKRAAPLTRGGESVGVLEVLLRLTFRRDEAHGVLVFEWPERASGHSAIAPLAGWVDQQTDPDELHGAEVSCSDVMIDNGADQEAAGKHLKVAFPLQDIPEDLLGLLGLAARIGVEKTLMQQIEKAKQDREAARIEAELALLEPEPTVEEPVVEEEPVIEIEVEQPRPEPVVELEQPEPEPTSEPATQAPPPSVADARADAIEHNQVFDSKIHPQIAVNDEVTNSDGVTFRLVQKRRGSGRRRVWTRVTTGVVQSLAARRA